jgi:glutamate--cysteine ligase
MESYIESLLGGLRTPYPDYEKIGVKDENGEYQQLNTHLLQIENEFYSTIRPKRTTRSGETPIRALKERGVEYIEVRCIDLNPFLPTGFDREQADFLDIFLLHCLFSDSTECDCDEYREILVNQKETVYEGRNPAFRLRRRGEELSVAEWGSALLTEMMPLARLLDDIHSTTRFSAVMTAMESRIADSNLTPSAQILAEISGNKMTYFQWALAKSREHKATLMAEPLTPEVEAYYRNMAAVSLQDQQAIEATDTRSFEDYLESYFSQHRP